MPSQRSYRRRPVSPPCCPGQSPSRSSRHRSAEVHAGHPSVSQFLAMHNLHRRHHCCRTLSTALGDTAAAAAGGAETMSPPREERKAEDDGRGQGNSIWVLQITWVHPRSVEAADAEATGGGFQFLSRTASRWLPSGDTPVPLPPWRAGVTLRRRLPYLPVPDELQQTPRRCSRCGHARWGGGTTELGRAAWSGRSHRLPQQCFSAFASIGLRVCLVDV